MVYIYSEGNLLDNPNTYFYSEYKGKVFLDEWLNHRKEILRQIDNSYEQSQITFAKIELRQILDNYKSMNKVVTEQLLNAIGYSLKTDTETENLNFWLDKILKKFEVTKKIHEQYDENFLAIDKKKSKNIELYLLLSEIFTVAYGKLNKLTHLNVLLKINDTLCNIIDKLSSEQKSRVGAVIKDEIAAVTKLQKKLEVKL